MTGSTGWRDLELVCPACQGELSDHSGAAESVWLACVACDATYPVVLDIPDLRTRSDPYIGLEEDRDKGQTLSEACVGLDFPDALRVYYQLTSVVTEAQANSFIASVLAASDRAHDTLAQIESELGAATSRLLDLGCGTAPLAIEAAGRYSTVVGVDLAFRWLVMAKIRLATAGVEVPLICACAEALPFPDSAFDRVVGESVVEHFEDQPLAIRETARVMSPGADLYLTTPNRFSLGPDPHVGLIAGGFLPDRWISAYIRKRGGIPPRRNLLTDRGLRRLLRDAGFGEIMIRAPKIAEGRIAGLAGPLKLAARAYGASLALGPLGVLLRKIGPLLSASAVKPTRMDVAL